MKTRINFALCLALVGIFAGTGCQKTDSATAPPATAANAPAVAAEQTPAPSPPQPETTTPTPIKDALNTLFAKEAEDSKSPFPKGTHLLNIDLKGKTASVDVSKEFNELANKGESMEGLAQRKLCAALAQFPTVDTLRVTVEGKDYESQASDWRSISVRPATEGAQSGGGSSKLGGLQNAGSVDR